MPAPPRPHAGTASQKKSLQRSAQKAPTVLSIHSLKVAGKDCTCGEFNIAIWFKPTQIEVPHRYLLTDDEAAQANDEADAEYDQVER